MSESLVFIQNDRIEQNRARAFIRGGPRQYLWYNPREVNAAVVTTGGLCPGLNNIIRHLTLSLY